jgi:hypothetical protein
LGENSPNLVTLVASLGAKRIVKSSFFPRKQLAVRDLIKSTRCVFVGAFAKSRFLFNIKLNFKGYF